MSQLQIEFEEAAPTVPVLKHLGFGKLFKVWKGGKNTYMKVKSINFLNNSNLISDVFARGDCLVVNLERGTVSVMDGTIEIVPLEGKMLVKRKISIND